MKRKQWVEIVRFIGIVFVVFGHAITPQLRQENELLYMIHFIIYIFHMPLFFFLSGYLFCLKKEQYKKEGFRSFLINKSIRLMFPYLSLSIVLYLCYFFIKNVNLFTPFFSGQEAYHTDIKTCIIEIVTLNNHIDEHLWFIYSLFFIFIIQYFVNDYFIKPSGIIFQIVLCIFGTTLPGFNLMFRIFQYTIYFSLGVCLAEREELINERVKKYKVLLFFLTMFFFFISIYMWSGSTFLEDKVFVVKILRRTSNFCSSVFVILLLFSFSNEYVKRNKIPKITTLISKNEYAIYLFHQPYIVSGSVGILRMLTVNNKMDYPIILIGTVLGIIIPMFIGNILRNNKVLRIVFLGEK